MTDSSFDLLSLNEEILLKPAEVRNNPLVTLLELEMPELEFLCPLARAIYLIETKRPERINAREVLNSCFLIDDSLSGSCLELSDDYACIEEQVSHVIFRKFNHKEIALGFTSSGDMMYCQGFWDDYLRSKSGTQWPLVLLDEPLRFNEEIFRSLDSEANTGPSAYPTDRGEFIGTVTYSLTSINGVGIEGPTLQDSKIESSWDNLSEAYNQRYPEQANSDREGQMCWLHYLDAPQADMLGISASEGNAIGENSDYPGWVPKTTSDEELEATWISPDEMQESYSGGEMSVEESTEAWFALGCGADWYPGADLIDEDDSDDEASVSKIFDPMVRPLITANIARGKSSLPNEILVIKPYLVQLAVLLKEQQS